MGKKNFKHARSRGRDVVSRLGCGLQGVRNRLGRKRVKGIVYSFQKCRRARHEGVTKAAVICTIAHFLGEDIRRITFATDMFDGYSAVFHPLTCGVLSVLDMVINFRREIVTSFDTCLIVIVKW